MQVEFTNQQTIYNGRTYKAGEKLEVDDDRAAQLVKAGTVKEVNKGAKSKEG